MKHPLVIPIGSLSLAMLLLAGCTSSRPVIVDSSAFSASSASLASSASSASLVSLASSASFEQLPSTLSIPYFSTMRLSGTGLTLTGILRKTDAYVQHGIRYSSNGLIITGILNIPEGPGPFPVLIFNHGHIATSIYTQGRGLRREQDYLAREGFVVLHTDYRGHAGSDKSPMTEKTYDGNLEYAMDSINAILALRVAALPRVDASRVGMLGHSLGGGVTLAVLTAHPDLVDAAVLYAPVHANVWENFSRWRKERESDDRTTELSGTPETNPDFWRDLSPQTFLDRITAPVLIFHGDRDTDVPKAWSDDLALRLRTLGKTLTYVEYPGEAHEFGPQWTDFMQKTSAFFTEHLGTNES